jgi:manganese transport protein
VFAVIVFGLCCVAVTTHPPAGPVDRLGVGFAGLDSVVLATAIIGATVVSDAIYVHSAPARGRTPVGSEFGYRA